MTKKLIRIATVVSLVAGINFSLAFGAAPIDNSATTSQSADQTASSASSAVTSDSNPTATQTNTTTMAPTTPAAQSNTNTTPAATQTTTTPITPTTTNTNSTPGATPNTTNPSAIYVSPSTTAPTPTTTQPQTNTMTTGTGNTSATPGVNGTPNNNLQPIGPNSTTGVTPAPTGSGGAIVMPGTNTANPSVNTMTSGSVISEDTLVDFSQKAALAAFSYSFQNYKQSMQTMQSYFTKKGWISFSNALNDSNNLAVVQKEKLTVSATLNGQAQVIQQQQTATGQSWQVTVPILVTYQNDKNQTVTQDLTVKLSIITVSTNENPNGIGVMQFIAMPNVASTTSTTSTSPTTTTP